MPRKKDYSLKVSIKGHNDESASENQPKSTLARTAKIDFMRVLGESARILGAKSIDLSDWLNKSVDDWVYMFIACCTEQLHKHAIGTPAAELRRSALTAFLPYISRVGVEGSITQPSELTQAHILGFHRYLQDQVKAGLMKHDTIRKYYSGIRCLLTDMTIYGYIALDISELYKTNPFRNQHNPKGTSTPAYTDDEMRAIAKALKSDLSATVNGKLKLTPRESLVVKYLIVASRVGDSTVPLLEIGRDQPKKGLIPGTLIVTTEKRRAHKHIQRVLREATQAPTQKDKDSSTPIVVPPDAAVILALVMKETERLIPHAPPHMRQSIWLYQTLEGPYAGRVTALNQQGVSRCARDIVSRHGLTDGTGKRLRLTVRRFRATFGNLAFEATDGNVQMTADLLGNTPEVAGSSYLPVTAQVKAEGAAFMASLMSRLRNRSVVEDESPVKPSATPTPVAGCSDPMNGEFAPKDGANYCEDWVKCLFCPQCAIAGGADELWRLFSFRDFAQEEFNRLVASYGTEPTGDERSDLLKELYSLAIPFIKEFALANFKDRHVYIAELRAREEPHPFWRYQEELAQLRKTN